MYLPADVSVSALVGFYRRVWVFADATIDELPLDTVGSPPWWPAGSEVTLHHMLVRVVDDLARHAGQADILRESIDGAAGLNRRTSTSRIRARSTGPPTSSSSPEIARTFPEPSPSTLHRHA